MEVKTAICPNCGAKIRVNPLLNVATCRYCQAEYEVEPAIHAYEMSLKDEKESPRDRIKANDKIEDEITTLTINITRYKHLRIYQFLRYEVVNKKRLGFHNYVFDLKRLKVFEDPKLKEIEDKILMVIKSDPHNKSLISQEKQKWMELASYKGLLD